MKFPLVKNLSEKLYAKKDIYTQNFAKQIENILYQSENISVLKKLPQGEYKFDFAIDIREERSDKNKESYIIIKENDEIPKGYKRILDCKPYEIDTLNCQLIGIEDKDFFYQILQNLKTRITAQFDDIGFSFESLLKMALMSNSNTENYFITPEDYH
ncbi:hypothetical protein H2279_08735, partial [Campylobacter sp. B0100352/1]|uniref:hypothetical protein n=1 Tax=Campylobacter sp. B0100352/1 TaxID=2735783 RepID=UPI001D939AD7|nr:hypothetical protein [Campylobacter sp. B0100352/1]